MNENINSMTSDLSELVNLIDLELKLDYNNISFEGYNSFS